MTDLAWVALRAASLVLLFQAAGATLFTAAFVAPVTRSAPAIRRTGARAASGLTVSRRSLFEPVHWRGSGRHRRRFSSRLF